MPSDTAEHGMPPGFHRLIAAQFFSALADNALLILAIALLHAQSEPLWWVPLLKFCFTLAYVVLAPFAGPLADARPKARWMAWTNGLKALGLVALLLGLHPLAAFVVVGTGAALYAPAKYGLVTELVGPRRLVAANGWIEVAAVMAVLLGTLIGGLLVSVPVLDAFRRLGSGQPLHAAMVCVLGLYGVAAALNRGLPDSGARYAAASTRVPTLVREFWVANRQLWADPLGGLSLAVTTLFWGVGAMMQFAVLRWAESALGYPLSAASQLQAVVAVGVVVGAVAVGNWVPLGRAVRVLPAGVALGLLLPVLASVNTVWLAVPLLVLIGVVGGVLVVPMNALLQHRGAVLLSAGRSIAVQNFNENLSILVLLGGYAALLAADLSITTVMWLSGLAIAGLVAALIGRERLLARQVRQTPQSHPARPSQLQ